MKTLPLSQGFVAKVDDGDYFLASAFKWSAVRMEKRVYAVRSYARSK